MARFQPQTSFRRRVADEFRKPVPGIFPLDAEVAALMRTPVSEYWIEQSIAGGPWQRKCRYGDDLELAVSRVRWWNRLLRGRRSYRVVSVLGDCSTVIFGAGSHE